MARVSASKKENPRLLERKLADGRTSLYFEYYLGYKKVFDEESGKEKIKHNRKQETRNLYLFANPRTKKDRKHNTETLKLARSIRQKREDEITANRLQIQDKNKARINFLDYCDRFLAGYPNKDIRIVKYSIRYFKAFVAKEKGLDYILPNEITELVVIKFKVYLEASLNGETPHNYFTKFKKICRSALEEGYPVDPRVLNLKNSRKEGLKKDILLPDEIQKLASAKCNNKEVKRAFLFCLNTGLRFCDAEVLTWRQVDESRISVTQSKTQEKVFIDLNSNAVKILGERGDGAESVFNLPSFTTCLLQLKSWTKKAKIDKNITWHSARHSFAVNLLIHKNDIKTVSSLLGHTGLKHTEKYTRVVDGMKKTAVNSLPEIEI